MCGTAREDNSPTLWTKPVAANGERKREVIEQNFALVAKGLGVSELAPIVTPALTKKIASVCLCGTNLDNLVEGLSPFIMFVMDHTMSTGSQVCNEALTAAENCNDLLGAGTADPKDV